ncbi:RHS repeat protein [Fulvivirga sp. 29W222]|uniref:RHS repeat protein n=1 Tax=Fulvivirga marina TaxID=2494733 RepID=A0A937G394_9BACT|nr:RHS repeat protein [Fulvivirga marina]MBL6449638.1 RHS repeat protein [Fulvivirga marina]
MRVRVYTYFTFICLFLLFIGRNGLSQSEKFQVSIPPPPDAAALGKYGEIPVGTYTGIPSINIPLYNVEGRHLSLPISLSYHASGVKVEEVSSWVGAGWSLSAGGVITRSINGLTDFKSKGGTQDKYGIAQPITYLNGNQITGRKIPKGIGVSCGIQWEDDTQDLNTSKNAAFISDMLFEANMHDTEPDNFYFNFNGLSGKFLFNEDREIITDSKTKLIFDKFPTQDDDSWIISTLDGVSYEFGGTTYDQGVEQASWIEWTKSLFFPEGVTNTQASSWYLKSITHPSGEQITFSYTRKTYKFKTFSGGYRSVYRTDCLPAGSSTASPHSFGGVVEHEVDGLFLKDITITYPDNSATLVKFHTVDDKLEGSDYTASGTNLKTRLDQIELIEKSSAGIEYLVGSFKFLYDNLANKLWLTSVRENSANGTPKPPYVIDYYNHTEYPLRTSDAVDLWGFYNGKTTNSGFYPKVSYGIAGAPLIGTEGDNYSPVEDYMKYGIISSIKYPTGGITSFDFGANHFSNFETVDTFSPLEICRDYNSATPCGNGSLTAVEFEVEQNEIFSITTNINHPYNEVTAAEVCDSKYSSCNGIFTNSDDFTIYGTEKSVFLDYSITGPNTSNVGNNLVIKNKDTGVYVKSINVAGGYAPVDKIALNLPAANYTLIATSMQTSTDVVSGTLIREAYIAPKPTYIVRLIKPDGTNTDISTSGVTDITLPKGTYTLRAHQVDREVTGARAHATIKQKNPTYSYKKNYGAGLRVNRQVISNGTNNIDQVIEYSYQNADGSTSGKLMNKPVTHYLTATTTPSKDGISYFNVYSSNAAYPLSNSAAGSFVGYGRVEVKRGNSGKSVYVYSNNTDSQSNYDAIVLYSCVTFNPESSNSRIMVHGTPSLTYSYSNGNLLYQYDYTENGDLVKQVENSYKQTIYTTYGLKIKSLPLPGGVYSLSSWDPEIPCNPLAYKYYQVDIGFSLLENSKITTYGGNGEAYAENTKYGYSSDNLLIWKEITDSEDKQRYVRYVHKTGTSLVQEVATSLYHHTTDPLKGEYIMYNEYFPVKYYQHETLGANETPDPDSDLGYGKSNYKLRKQITYNNHNNIVELNEDGYYTSFIWSSNQKHLLAVIENGRLSDVESIFGVDFEGSNSGLTSAEATALRNSLSYAMVTTYNYSDRGEILSIADPNGQAKNYKYDSFGRLEWVKDSDNSILSKFIYNYKSE